MPLRREGQLEKCIDDATRKNDFQALEQLLETDFSEGFSHKCSKQFLNKVDKLICQELDNEEVKNVSTLLNTLQKHGRNINILGDDGFPAMIEHGLVQKMVNWFEKAKEILQNRINEKNDQFLTLMEDFFDVLMIVHDTSSEGKIQVLENFILRTCSLAADKRMNIYIQKEAVRKLNAMLDAMPRDTRKKFISAKEMLHVTNDMGKRILDAGDYDLQVAITEALCRMMSEKQRGELASQWFSMEFVTNAFKGIKDSEFETDCRKFLNQVNGMLGDKRRVFTYPCLSVILDKHELQMPVDDNLEEFWIDFNIGSRSISFYVAADDEGHQWETVSIPEDEVEIYIIEGKDKKKLTINLKSPMSVGNQEGEKIIMHFDSALEIVEAVRNVYGAKKCQGFMRKNTMSVAKTAVHVIFDESGSQVLVPESQISPLKEKTCKPLGENSSYSLEHHYPQIQKNLNQKDKVEFPIVQSKITPGKRKVSEASMIVPCSARLSMQSPFPLVNTSTPRKGRVKMPLQMSSAEKTDIFPMPERRTMNFSLVHEDVPVSSVTKSLKKHNSAARKHIAIEKMAAKVHEEDFDNYDKQKLDGLIDIVPDSQPVDRNDKLLLPGILENSVAEIKTQKKQMCWVPEKIISHCNKQNISALGSTFHQAPNVSAGVAKQRAFSSIFESTSSELKNRLRCSGEIMEQQQNETNKIPVKNGKINSLESRNSFMHLDEKIPKNSTKIVPSKSEMSLNSTRKNDSYVVNPRLSKLVTKTTGEAGLDISSGKQTANKKINQKGKSKEMVETAEMFVSKISDRYKQKDDAKSTRKLCQSFSHCSTFLNKSSFSVNKRKSQNKSSRDLKTTTLLNITTKHLTDDVYNFNLSGSDEPTIKLGIQEFHLTKLEATSNLSKKMNHDHEGESTTQEKQDIKNRTNKNKQHLFSDTDTEYRGDDAMTDISWLRESNRKPKPQVIDYSRARKQKKSKTLEAKKSPMTSHIRKMSPPKKTKNKPEHKSIKNKAVSQPKVQHSIVSNESVKGKSVDQEEKSTKSKYGMPKKKVELSPVPSSESPASCEIMRCSGRSTEEEPTQEHISMRRSSLSSFLQESEKEESIDNIKNNSALVKTNKKSVQSKQSPETSKKLMSENESLSPVLSPVSLPNLTPFITTKKFTSDQDAETAEPEEKVYGADESASIKNDPLDRSSDTELKDFSENCKQNRREGSVPSSELSTPRGNRELCRKEPPAHIHESGPTRHPHFKRLYQGDTGSDSDEVDVRRKERKTKLLHKKLFKADDSTFRVSESISTLSVNDASAFDGEGWDADSSNVGMICQKLHKEFARKVQSRSKKMDSFSKQSLKAAHQHMSTMNTELHERRTQQLEHFHSCIIKELENFERDSLALKNMEKEFSNFSKKHSQIFSNYNKSEQQRLQNLKTSFEKNIYHTADCEENIFTSEMHLMKEDMKGLQEKLLKEMHEEELLNVRRGLQSLFMAEDRKLL
ncbi:synaptonemal complex protein 2 isoform X2 [Hemicordylus capensis]|uniref:synaptonemal complex protein 2 isoform X2 n=1 Tax=Hemicordylus capensis TaxID=884348 RepID=UPI0023022EC3|nr:synaptonemal complex protein 2 isoform X2 [Hemicordylus capensis]